jgi:hypothetical protein
MNNGSMNYACNILLLHAFEMTKRAFPVTNFAAGTAPEFFYFEKFMADFG